MKKFVAIAIVFQLCFIPMTFAGATGLTLASDGKTPYVIVLSQEAIPAERTAALQLQAYLKQVTGADFKIHSESEVSDNTRQILVGEGDRIRKLLPQVQWEELKSDGVLIKVVGENLVIAGGRPRGSLYGVFQFLEDTVGCRWWTPDAHFIPSLTELTIPSLNVQYVPKLEYREHYTRSTQTDPIFATIMRENGFHQKQDESWGGHYHVLGLAHTFGQLLPPEKYFATHPEWYTDALNGSLPSTSASLLPGPAEYQLCLSNPEVLDALSKEAINWFETLPNESMISISQMDNQFYCRCPDCAKLVEQEGSQMGPLLKFVNAAAERISQRYPNVIVETLAYHHTITPPKTIRPGKNVLIRMAPVDADFGHPMQSIWNGTTTAQLRGWAEISPRLYLWTYLANFSKPIYPHPTWAGIATDLRFYVQNGVTGIFIQGDAYSGEAGDFVPLRAWLVGKLMWNPDLDQKQLTQEFLKGYYGAAAPFLERYLTLVQNAFNTQNRALDLYNADFSFFTPETLSEAVGLFAQAQQAVAGDSALAHRVRRERISLDAVVLYRYEFLKRATRGDVTKYTYGLQFNDALAEFKRAIREYNVEPFASSATFDQDIGTLLNIDGSPAAELPEFARSLPPADVVDIQPGAFNLYRPGVLTWSVEDQTASGGVAAAMTGTSQEWVIQVQLGKFIDVPDSTWRVYLYARLDALSDVVPGEKGLAGGIYDTPSRVERAQFTAPFSDMSHPTYQRLDLGSHRLAGAMMFFFSSAENPAIDKVYIDRILLVREHR